jgi:hypothetical protein
MPTDDIEFVDVAGISLISEQVSLFIKNIQGQIIPTGISLYGNEKFRAGLSCSNSMLSSEGVNLDGNSDLPGLSASVFGMYPLGYTILGDHYVKGELAYERKMTETQTGNIRNNCFSVPISLVTSERILGLEVQIPIGLYYSCLWSETGSLNQELGMQLGMEFKLYNNLSIFNNVSIALESKVGFQNIFPSNTNGVAKINSIGVRFSYYFNQ